MIWSNGFRTRFTWTMASLVMIGLAGTYILLQAEHPHSQGLAMDNSRFQVEHVRRVTDRPFEKVTKAFEVQLGKYDADVNKAAVAMEDHEEGKAKIAALAGPSGFMLFATYDHGALVGLAGKKGKAIQYVLGNPLFALQMTKHDIRASLYAPLRVLIYENEQGKTCVEYDKAATLFGQFGNKEITPMAVILDGKLEALVTKAIE